MSVTKLPSGNYRIRKMINGKLLSMTIDHQPGKEELVRLYAAHLDTFGAEKASKASFDGSAAEYLDSVRNVLSPSTMREYTRTKKYLSETFPRFCGLPVRSIGQREVQTVVNQYAKGHAPKSVFNLYGFIRSVMKFSSPSLALSVTLPAARKKEAHIPTEEEVKAVCEALRGSRYEIAIALASLGLRRSELCALTPADLDGNVLTINKAMVQNERNEWIVKHTTKTAASTRKITIPDSIADLIRERGEVYTGSPGRISHTLNKVQDRLGIPRFGVHRLRHFYASEAHFLRIPDSYIMASGGWATDTCLKSVYRHALDDKRAEMDKRAVEHIGSLFS